MRLLNSKSKELEYFTIQFPQYAILSHRWREEEVTFQDLSRSDVRSLKGYRKLSGACDMASRLGFQYVWIDTCCIDKSSSSELSEAINSMYEWYKNAGICLAYLDDVSKSNWDNDGDKSFRKSVWFLRGWTLQELIAPQEVLFVTEKWEVFGTKTSLVSKINDITRIDEQVLLTGALDGISVAQKMFWAKNRKTTRIEDEAYSLMGIFGIYMPTIYGEGRNAFVRLQEEILKKSDDQSIFAWGELLSSLFPSDYNSGKDTGLLAPSPSSFSKSDGIRPVSGNRLEDIWGTRNPDAEFTITNHGIRIRLPVKLVSKTNNIYIAYLACEDEDGHGLFAVLLQQLDGNRYTRVSDYETPFLAVPYSSLELSEIQSDNWIYITRAAPNPSLAWVESLINTDSVSDFCTKFGFAISSSGALDSRDNRLTDGGFWSLGPTETGLLLLQNNEMKYGLLIATKIQGDRVRNSDKNFFSVKVCLTANSGGYMPYVQNQPLGDLFNSWKETGEYDKKATTCALVKLPDGRNVVVRMACVSAPVWTTVDGPADCRYSLFISVC